MSVNIQEFKFQLLLRRITPIRAIRLGEWYDLRLCCWESLGLSHKAKHPCLPIPRFLLFPPCSVLFWKTANMEILLSYRLRRIFHLIVLKILEVAWKLPSTYSKAERLCKYTINMPQES